MGTRNGHVKFGRKIPNRFGKIATKPQEGIFLTHSAYEQIGPVFIGAPCRLSVDADCLSMIVGN